jgi:hypothetical protein
LNVSVRLAIAVILVIVVGCGSKADEASREARAGDEPSAEAASRVERCTERFLERVESGDLAKAAEIRRYAETTYCARFERRGWIDDDGTLSIDAHVDLVESGSEVCASAEAGGEAGVVPCEELERRDGPEVLDCAILHLVRKSEVRKYVEELERSREVRCDDGTPLDELGAR